MPHGFLSYNFPIWGMKEESMEGIKQGTLWIQELFGKIKNDLINADKVKEISPFAKAYDIKSFND
jgi:hypothetical protein